MSGLGQEEELHISCRGDGSLIPCWGTSLCGDGAFFFYHVGEQRPLEMALWYYVGEQASALTLVAYSLQDDTIKPRLCWPFVVFMVIYTFTSFPLLPEYGGHTIGKSW